IFTEDERSLAERLEEGLEAIDHRFFASGYNVKPAGRGRIGATEHRRREIMLPVRSMSLEQAARECNCDRTHRNVSAVLSKCCDHVSWSENDTLNGFIIGEHGDDHFATGGISRGIGDDDPLGPKSVSSTARAVIDQEPMACLEQVSRHRKPHVSESYE